MGPLKSFRAIDRKQPLERIPRMLCISILWLWGVC